MLELRSVRKNWISRSTAVWEVSKRLLNVEFHTAGLAEFGAKMTKDRWRLLASKYNYRGRSGVFVWNFTNLIKR
jgi:hypothetical protein